MAHVQITKKTNGCCAVSIDGVQVEDMILARGFSVEFPEEFPSYPVVTMLVAARVLEIDLPDAVVKALRETDAESALAAIHAEQRAADKRNQAGHRVAKKAADK